MSFAVCLNQKLTLYMYLRLLYKRLRRITPNKNGGADHEGDDFLEYEATMKTDADCAAALKVYFIAIDETENDETDAEADADMGVR